MDDFFFFLLLALGVSYSSTRLKRFLSLSWLLFNEIHLIREHKVYYKIKLYHDLFKHGGDLEIKKRLTTLSIS